jgi:hypothetical protein
MLDLDLCNDCHQSVGIPCILVYLLYVNEVSYLVGKPFTPLSTLSEKLCWSVLEISEDVHLFSVVERFHTLFLCCKICKISSDVWLHSARCQKIGAEEEGVLSRSRQPHRMRHPSNSSCHPRPRCPSSRCS